MRTGYHCAGAAGPLECRAPQALRAALDDLEHPHDDHGDGDGVVITNAEVRAKRRQQVAQAA